MTSGTSPPVVTPSPPRYVISTKTKQVLDWNETMKSECATTIPKEYCTRTFATLFPTNMIDNNNNNSTTQSQQQQWNKTTPLFMTCGDLLDIPNDDDDDNHKDENFSKQTTLPPLFCCNYVIGLNEPFIRIDRSLTRVSNEEREISRMEFLSNAYDSFENHHSYSMIENNMSMIDWFLVNTTRIESGHSLLVQCDLGGGITGGGITGGGYGYGTTGGREDDQSRSSLTSSPHHHHLEYVECAGEIRLRPVKNNNYYCTVEQCHDLLQHECSIAESFLFFEIVSINLQTSFFAFPDVKVLENWKRFGIDGFSLYRPNPWEMKGRMERYKYIGECDKQ
ncbi:hypothetical protein C9374_003753 [Naegleria lovaniensis]|uniref:Uncharacterized protein n=1 Tax=Naegleria lovaniensis TaxID=51637 RepID=A0AA88H0I8_NAELO|nr:uncharacterized protein C9374_003753 [Naegleria lovaniensis]KAG2393989.1 hypothetical protein C9374_003753 [Naegleria lovaniensis]